MNINVEKAKNHIKNLGFDIDLDYKIWNETLEYYTAKNDLDGLAKYISQLQNCGGYALEIPICIWPVPNYTFEEKVLRIMNLYPFVRLLSDSKLKENEYIVIYRAKGNGHHFIKINNNFEVLEKESAKLPQKFTGWGALQNAPQAVFAVLKQNYRDKKTKQLPQCNRNMFLNCDAYEYTEDGYTDIITQEAERPDTFERVLKNAYNNKKSTFIYNKKNFYLKTEKNDNELIYICNENCILGSICTDGETFIIELNEEKKNEIFGFEPITQIQICNEKETDILEVEK